jgi:hypothetical protein
MTIRLLFFNLLFWIIIQHSDAAPNYYVWLRAGLPVTLSLNSSLDPATLTTTTVLSLKTAVEVKVNDKIVISMNSIGFGKVVRIEKNKKAKAWEVTIEATEVRTIDGQMISLLSTPIKILIPIGTTLDPNNTLLNASVLNDTKISMR